jgi:hypothetical protein
MYAKLVLSAYVSPIAAMRDIGRLLVSQTPSTALLGAFSTTSSVVIDDTPAGWTYVGSNMASDRPTIADVAASTTFTGGNVNLCFSAPCLESAQLKYITLNNTFTSSTRTGAASGSVNGIVMSGAASATALGVVTNEGPRFFTVTTTLDVEGTHMLLAPGLILHLIATPRHCTIIAEAVGINAVWESSQTDVHTFQNRAPFVQYTHLFDTLGFNTKAITANGPTLSPGSAGKGFMTAAFAVTDVNTGTFTGSAEVTEGGLVNRGSLGQTSSTIRAMSINAAGSPVYQISPVFYSLGSRGYPVQYVSGVVPIYWTKGTLGTSGDNVDVGGDTYTFFNANVGYGVIMKTS